MEGLHWDSLSSSVQPRVWRHHRQEHKKNPKALNVDAVDNLFNSDHDIQGNKSCSFASESGRASGVIQQLAPAMDSINGGSSLNLLHRQQATVAGAGWQGGLTAELHTPLINRLYSSSPLSSLMPVGNLHAANGMEGDTLELSGDSLESLDCLLSTTNSNTDTSVEDDGISMLFSDCRNLWNFTSGSTISSGDSKNNAVIKDGDNQEACRQVSNHHLNSSNMRPSSSKRNKVPEEIKTPPNHYFDIFQSDSSTTEGGFQLITENPLKKPKLEKHQQTSNINFQQPNNNSSVSSTMDEPDTEAIAQVKEMIYRAAVFRPVSLDLEVVEKPKRKNVRISSDPQTVAARQRRERISERIRILQRLVPGGNKMDTASMLDEAANYLKFLRSQVKALETLGHTKFDSVTSTSTSTVNSTAHPFPSLPFNQNFPMQTFFPFTKP